MADNLTGVQRQIRQHTVIESDLEVLEKCLDKVDSDAHGIVDESPDELNVIRGIQTSIIELWEGLVEMSDERYILLFINYSRKPVRYA